MAGEKLIKSPDTQRRVRVPPDQRVVLDWPVLHYGVVPKLDISRWRFRVWGLVEKERMLTLDEFSALPRVQVLSDIHCVTGWSRLDNLWEGISTSTLKELVAILPEAKFAIVHGAQGFTTNLALDDFFAEDALFPFGHDGKELTPKHGYPVRLIVPRLFGVNP